MSKSNPTNYSSVTVAQVPAEGNVKIELRAKETFIGAFFVPKASMGSNGIIPENILRSRALHDLNVTFDRYTIAL